MNSHDVQPRQPRSVGRIIFAVLVGYVANALLIAGAEQVLPLTFSGTKYFVADVIAQCVIQVASGYVCSHIAKTKRRSAIITLIALGLLIGAISVAASWHTEPHWYAVALLVVYGPCIWIGYRLDIRLERQPRP